MAFPPAGGNKSGNPFAKGGALSGGNKKDSSSDPPSGGLRFKSDPTLPAGQRAVVDGSGKRVAVVKKVGAKWVCSSDSYKQQFDSPQAVLKYLAMKSKLVKGGSDTTPGAVKGAVDAAKK